MTSTTPTSPFFTSPYHDDLAKQGLALHASNPHRAKELSELAVHSPDPQERELFAAMLAFYTIPIADRTGLWEAAHERIRIAARNCSQDHA